MLKTILIVDDEPNVRLMFRTTLEGLGYELAEAADGASALVKHAIHSCDLILLDLHMPGLDGMDTLRALREHGDDVPVVILTAHGSIPHAVEAMKLGAIDFVTKPLKPEALRDIVADVLRRHRDATTRVVPAPHFVTVENQFVENMRKAKLALNRRSFDEADIFLKQAMALEPNSAEAHNLLGVLHEFRNEHDDSYREYKAALKADRHYEPAKHNMMRYYERFTFGQSDVPIDEGNIT
jgi:DNA-binding response OmpR family regulator